MLWSPKQLVILLLLPLMACGFEPMYGDAAHRTTHTPLEGNLLVEGISGRDGQILKAALEDQFNPEGITVAHPQYHLHVVVRKVPVPAVIQSDGTVQRYDVRMYSDFTLTQEGVKDPLLQGTVMRIGSYNVISNAEFASFSAERDTSQRILGEMAQDYLLRINGYFAGKPAT